MKAQRPSADQSRAPGNRLCEPLAQVLQRPLGDWRQTVQGWRHSPPGRALETFVDDRVSAGVVVYPCQVLRALELTQLARTRVVIVGQDPYHGPGQAEGLAFSVPAGKPLPPSLRNMLRELHRDCGTGPTPHGHLGAWAGRGILLLNTTLTVEDGLPGSHAKRGWEALTAALIEAAARDLRPKVFMLWGTHAQGFAAGIEASGRHLVLRASHPSPLSAARGEQPFVGCGHFSSATAFLAQRNDPDGALDWSLS